METRLRAEWAPCVNKVLPYFTLLEAMSENSG